MPNVLLLSGRFEVRGSCAYTLRLAENLPAQGVQSTVICPDASAVDLPRRQRLKIQEYPSLDWPLFRRWMWRLLLRDLQQRPPDLIHLQSRRVLKLGRWLARKLNRPYILTVHDSLNPKETVQLRQPDCARVITVSESVKRDFIAKTAFPADKVRVIATGADPDVQLKRSPVLDPGHVPVIGTAGPLESVKGLPFFLGAAVRVLAEGHDVEFLVSGAGPEEGNLRRLARELGISRHVVFAPFLLNFTESLAAMDVFCLPSLRQGIGTIMLEAMALGIPVIASRVGGVYSVLHDQETGLLVPPSDSRALADRILELICDPLRARHIGEAGRELVRRDYALERMVLQTADLYREVVEQGAAATVAVNR